MKTAVIWVEDGPQYAVIEDDWARFNGVVMGEDLDGNLEFDLSNLVFDKDGDYLIDFITLEEFAQAIRDGAQVIECGFAI
jgi:hypothetical protein